MSLSIAELVDLAGRVTYKPGWQFIVRELDPVQGPFLTILTTQPDAYRPEQVVPLRVHSPVPPVTTQEAFLEWVLWRIQTIERHEIVEWFRVDGRMIYNPHAGLDEGLPSG